MVKKDAAPSDLLLNRELSWLEFNDRVLQQGKCDQLPLMERLKFLSIVSSNLDEFFMIRVAGLHRQKAAGTRKRDPSGLTPTQQLALISVKTRDMVAQQAAAIGEVFEQLAGQDLCLVRRSDWAPKQREFLAKFCSAEVLPVLTPLAVEELNPSPLFPGLQLFIALLVEGARAPAASERSAPKLVVIPVPGLFPRFVNIPAEKGTGSGSQSRSIAIGDPSPLGAERPSGAGQNFALGPEGRYAARGGPTYLTLLEEIILDNAGSLVGERKLRASTVFRITRDADVTIQEAQDEDLLDMIEDAVVSRRRRDTVRLEISAGSDPDIRKWLTTSLKLAPEQVYEIDGLLDAKALMQIIDMRPAQNLGSPTHPSALGSPLKVPDWPPQPPRDLIGAEDAWSAMQDHDILLFHPYETFDPVIRMVSDAADDPQVLAIKQTLYRPSTDSPIVRSLARAAENGKEVTVLVELRARFDESKNVTWARRLADAEGHSSSRYTFMSIDLLSLMRDDSRYRS